MVVKLINKSDTDRPIGRLQVPYTYDIKQKLLNV